MEHWVPMQWDTESQCSEILMKLDKLWLHLTAHASSVYFEPVNAVKGIWKQVYQFNSKVEVDQILTNSSKNFAVWGIMTTFATINKIMCLWYRTNKRHIDKEAIAYILVSENRQNEETVKSKSSSLTPLAWAFTRIWRNGVWRYLRDVDEVKWSTFSFSVLIYRIIIIPNIKY